MIGGTDHVIPTPLGPDALRLALRVILSHWPDAIVEDANTSALIPCLSEPPSDLPTELFVYQDEAALRSWDDLGLDPSNAHTMIHLLQSDESLTLVVDDEPSAMILSLVDKVDSCVRFSPHYTERS